MKIFHISDLHIGKMLQTYDLSEIQRDVFEQIIEAAKKAMPDAIVIAGDIYDKSAPSGDSFNLFNNFLIELSELTPSIPVMIIAGNHDSSLRLNYASAFLEKHNIYIAATLPKTENERLKKIVLNDSYGTVNFYLLPFTRPADARNLYGDSKEIHTYDEAVAAMIERENVDYSKRNVIVAHQFFIGSTGEPDRRDSEMRYISVGGIDSVNISHIEKFDYAALGHIHTSQKISCEHIRYSGTPLKYSVSESLDEKSITVAEIGEKGKPPVISKIPLTMKRDVIKLRGTLEDIIKMTGQNICEDYVSITLTDENVLFRPKDRLTEFYSYILEVFIDNARTNSILHNDGDETTESDPIILFNEFYQEMNGQPMTDDEQDVLLEVVNTLHDRLS